MKGSSAPKTLITALVDFRDPRQEWRRLIGEFVGTFLLVLVAAGSPMMNAAFPGTVSREASVAAPGLMVMALIMAIGKVSGAHLNPAVTLAFALRGDFPWRRVPGYLITQCGAAATSALLLQVMVGVPAGVGGTYPAAAADAGMALMAEAVLTFGLVTVILGTASGAQNVGVIGAIGVGGYVAVAGLWASPLSGASMNPARSFGPSLISANFTDFWIYVVGPVLGAAAAVGVAWLLRGPAGGVSGSLAAQGSLFPEIKKPSQH